MEALNISQGIAIIDGARPAGETPTHVTADHGAIYAGAKIEDWPLSGKRVRQLLDMGWEYDERLGRWVAEI